MKTIRINDTPESKEKLKHHPVNRPIVLRNRTCAYCISPFSQQSRPTKEHVIGRRFVPLGTLNGQWNLILNVCRTCNGEKADLENDISVITMLPDASGKFAVNDDRLQAEVARKSKKSISRLTRRPVMDSHESLKIKTSMGPFNLNFDMVAPAQIDATRALRLARFHFQGFFYLISYVSQIESGHFAPGVFHGVFDARRADWGAPEMRWFMDITKSWHPRVNAVAADGFFKIVIRRQSETAPVWSWAVEWNQSMRVVGFAGDDGAIATLVEQAPYGRVHVVHETPTESLKFRGMSRPMLK